MITINCHLAEYDNKRIYRIVVCPSTRAIEGERELPIEMRQRRRERALLLAIELLKYLASLTFLPVFDDESAWSLIYFSLSLSLLLA